MSYDHAQMHAVTEMMSLLSAAAVHVVPDPITRFQGFGCHRFRLDLRCIHRAPRVLIVDPIYHSWAGSTGTLLWLQMARKAPALIRADLVPAQYLGL